jgi:formyltetrahydrofolate deformylase
MSQPDTLTALLSGPDQVGLVARVSGKIFEQVGNILHADQHRDMEEGVFFQRIEWEPRDPRRYEKESEEFISFAHELGMAAQVISSSHRKQVALFVSKEDHCFHDLALRWKAGEYNADLVAVISNHEVVAEAALNYGVPFYYIPFELGELGKQKAEQRQLELLKSLKIELVVLARYMQVLSADFLKHFGRPVINIHHSFLPAFAGGKPYHKAHERGVKLIGATAHYATELLDEGPIIQQDVVRVTHRHAVADLIRKGRDLEKTVLAQAIRWHLESRVLVYGHKTVVFD